jgi:hypothetical protein
MRAPIHYTTAAILLTVYGGQVCPFIETIPFMVIGAIISSKDIARQHKDRT